MPTRAQLPLPRLVDLADDRVVADVLLDRVFEVGRAHASLSIARSLALRARGLLRHFVVAGLDRPLGQDPDAPSPRARARGTCA